MTENKINSEAVKNYFTKLQTDILNAVEIVDGKNFLVDSWQKIGGWWRYNMYLGKWKYF